MQFKDYNKTLLFKIGKALIKKGFTWEDPYHDVEKNIRILSPIFNSISNLNGGYISYIDIEFFADLISKNEKNFYNENSLTASEIENLIVPKLNNYHVPYTVKINADIYYDYSMDIRSYNEKFVKANFFEKYHDGEFYYTDGKYINRDIENEDLVWLKVEEEDIEEIVDSINESYKKEYKFNKILDSVDESTLRKLKKIIDDKLKTLD